MRGFLLIVTFGALLVLGLWINAVVQVELFTTAQLIGLFAVYLLWHIAAALDGIRQSIIALRTKPDLDIPEDLKRIIRPASGDQRQEPQFRPHSRW